MLVVERPLKGVYEEGPPFSSRFWPQVLTGYPWDVFLFESFGESWSLCSGLSFFGEHRCGQVQDMF